MSSTLPITEKAFQQQVIDLARFGGWLVYHPFNSKRSHPGYPDLTLVHPKRRQVLWVELKTEEGRLSEQQDVWLRALAEARADVRVWRPSDWPIIEETLTGKGSG